jgi:copper chaperone
MSTTETYEVTGMTCDHCVRAVSQAVEALDGVEEVEVDLGSGALTVRSQAGVGAHDVGVAVREAGYTLAAQG